MKCPYATDQILELVHDVFEPQSPEKHRLLEALRRTLLAERLAEVVDDIDRIWTESGLPDGTIVRVHPGSPGAAQWLKYESACKDREEYLGMWRRRNDAAGGEE